MKECGYTKRLLRVPNYGKELLIERIAVALMIHLLKQAVGGDDVLCFRISVNFQK